jgi:hypothetical protein
VNKRYFLLAVLLLFLHFLQAQTGGRFSPEPEKYTGELRSFMNITFSEYQQQAMDDFMVAWDSGGIELEEQTDIISLSNKLILKKARPAPQFILFIQLINEFLSGSHDMNSYQAWKTGLHHIADNDQMQINDLQRYMMSSYRLLRRNTISQTESTTWKTDRSDYSFEFSDSVYVVFDNIILTCLSIRDSLKIYNASGIYNPLTITWHGNSGIVTWERSGFGRDEVYAELSDYLIDMRFPHFEAETVSFHNTNYLDFTMTGRLEDRVEPVRSAESMNYPRFYSYQDNYTIKNIYENVNYRGGLSMVGSDLVGYGTSSQKASLNFYRNDSLKVGSRSEYFAFQPGTFRGIGTEVTVYIGNDSIYHPFVGMTYTEKDNTISLFRTQDFRSESPYYNNYHQVEMNFEQLRWNLNENVIEFKMKEGAASGLANFQSDNLFDARLYERLQGIDVQNPLVILRKYSEEVFSIEFSGYDFARYMRTEHSQVQQLLKRLATLGFIMYDLEDDLVTLRQKLYDWIYASVNFIDFDVINLVSEVDAPMVNGSLDLSTNDIFLNGVRQIRLSAAQNVTIYPANGEIILKSNRSFQFDGIIDAGLFSFYGKKFFFNYETFRVDLQDIDSLELRAISDDMDQYGRFKLMNLQSIIQDMTGELLIDYPDNKSGRKNFPQFPIFRSKEGSYVYYDDPFIQEGVYDKDRFFFELYPFEFDSIDNFDRSALNLKGRFVSAGIFPDIEQTLVVQPDNSLGFSHITDQTGIELYGGIGQYYQSIEMSLKGLRGSGRFAYLTASGISDNIIFHPDSMFTTLSEFTIGQQMAGIQYPGVKSNGNKIVFYPYQDQLVVERGNEPFNILNDSTYLDGDLELTSTGLSGSGRMELTNSTLISDQFNYLAQAFDADTADFRLKSLHHEGFTLMTDNVNAHVDFENRSGRFKTNEEYTLVEFPENKYISHLDLFIWDMDNAELEMGAAGSREGTPETYMTESGEEELIGPSYISTDPMQDSLYFVSTRATYDYLNNRINAFNVTFIKIADAYIYPKEGELVVESDGTLGQLEEAQFLVNRESKLHSMYNATINVHNRLDYSASAYYDYIDETGQKQMIYFDQVEVDDRVQTNASGMIAEDQDFTLSPYYGFQGRVSLSAQKKFLTFNGGVTLFHECERLKKTWFKFTTEINPEDIYIPVPEQPLDINMSNIHTAIMITRDSSHIFPAFFNRKKLPSNRYIVSADGYLHHDKESDEYRIASMEKLNNLSLPGNYLELPRTTCIQYGEGQIDLTTRFGQALMSTWGNVTYDMTEDKTDIESIVAFDFMMSDEAFRIMSAEIDSASELEAFDLTDAAYVKNIANIIGQERAEIMQAELGLYGGYQNIPEEMIHTIMFDKISFQWKQDTESFFSQGKLALGSINGNQSHRMIEGYMEISKRRSGDLLDVYLKLDDRTWYYFGYTRGVMHVLSSNRDFNMVINNLKIKQRKMKTKRNEVPYVFVVATSRKIQMFLSRIREYEQVETEQ